MGDQIDLGTTTKQGEIAYVYHASTVNLSQSTVLSSLPTDDGIYYYTKIDGQSYADGDNGTYSVTHNGETSTMDMYQLGNYIYDDASANTTTKYYEETDPVYQYKAANGDPSGSFVLELPSDGKYYITTIEGQDYSDGADGMYSVTLNGVISQKTMHEIAPIIASGNFRLYKAGTKTINSYDSNWDPEWNNLPDTRYIAVNDYYGYYERDVTGFFYTDGTYVYPAYYEITKAGGFSVLDTYMQAAHYQTTTENVTVGWAGNFYKLNDVYKSIDTETQVLFDDLLPLVSSSYPDPIFHEAVDNRTKYEDVLDFNVELVLKEDGPMTYTYVFYGSDYHNMLGYFYWNETPGMTPAEIKQARINAPRYVLMEDTWPETETETGKPNLQCYGDQNGADPHTPGGMSMPTWVDSGIAAHTGHYLQGTTYHMAYFGENYDQPASYEFPEGLHVAFFLITKAEGANAQTKGNGLFYSIQDMNEDQEVMTDGAGNKTILNNKHWWASQVGDSWDPDLERPNEGEVAAVFYSYKGSMVMGFEDDVDKDENDMLFLISAPVEPPVELSEEDEMTWIVACEDLGGTYDYDFNDLVFELTKDVITTTHKDSETGAIIDQTTTIEWFIRALAAGGTLPATIYYDNDEIGEIHSMLGSSNTGTPINVASGTTPSIGTLVKLENVAEEDQDEISEILPHIKIVVENKDENLNANEIVAPNKDATSNIPQMLLLPKGWDWPTEETIIYNVYPKFEQWASDMTQNGWIEDPTEKSINTNYFIVNPNK